MCVLIWIHFFINQNEKTQIKSAIIYFLGLTVKPILTQEIEPESSANLIWISKSPLAKKVAIVCEASGTANGIFSMLIKPAFIFSGQVQSIPNGASSGGQTVGLNASGRSTSKISHKSAYLHEPTLIPPAT